MYFRRYGSSAHHSEEERRRHEGVDFRHESSFGTSGGHGGFRTSAIDLSGHDSRHSFSHKSYEDNDRDLGADEDDYDYNDYTPHSIGEGKSNINLKF